MAKDETMNDRQLRKIEERYNPDYDLERDGPPVTWDVMLLAGVVDELKSQLTLAYTRIQSLEVDMIALRMDQGDDVPF